MGCAASRIDKEERVRICKERKMLMKQIVRFRKEFSNSQLMYVRALKNVGITLRQLTESESLETTENGSIGLVLPPPSPPPPLPPSPPPPPSFSPDSSKFDDNLKMEMTQEEIIDHDDEDDCSTPPPPPVHSSSWDFWDPFGSSSPVEEDNWAEANSEFNEEHEDIEEEEEISVNDISNSLIEKSLTVELLDDDSSMLSWHTKDAADLAMVFSRGKKTLANVIKELDDYFLKASAGGRDALILMDINASDSFPWQSSKDNRRNGYSSAKVFNALTWSWSSKSLQSTKDSKELCVTGEPCKPGAHSITLEKLCSEEQRLYKDVKDEEFAKIELERKSIFLQKLEDEHDSDKIEKAQLVVESLQSNIACLQQSIDKTCTSILILIDEELHPQLIALTSGLMSMWRKMYDCHQVQNQIVQQLSYLGCQESTDPTTEYHCHAAAQLKNEVTTWYTSFCSLVKSQKEYVRGLCRWMELAASFDSQPSGSCSTLVHALCVEWQLAFDSLPDKIASEAIKSFLLAIQSIVIQQVEELNQKRKSEKLEKKLESHLSLLAEIETKIEKNKNFDDSNSVLGPKHPLSIKRAKVDALKKLVEDETAKYMNEVEVTRKMTVNNLSSSLPNVFNALMSFSKAYAESLERNLNQDNRPSLAQN
ncbi:protein ALTERED PHOSPHATE STARVATION RESPONSE 1 [Impatiens glandulifera]|uniref:protein ALTERED PHOSPHATE STARVATION RESPONSE 1 n=1 Tax=Impatiens glandulifera TaxID=253017 RepID=UPI001FB17DF3|nr:protein ALTERED PHOSPHATE STARVATION RESPONSE 1 [Impatiens glandulifera]XP_047308292.1 protein ALTERED PHOSPHATE STARVATION RESPONSE 1 [Impatiens glandulifera]